MSHFLNFRATNDVIVSVNGLVVQSPFEIKNNDVITIKAKTNVTLNINGTSYTSAQTIVLSETNITVTYSTTGAEQSTYYILTINYSDEILSGLKGFLKNKDNKVLFPYAYGLKNPDGSDRPLGGVGVDLTYATIDEDGNFAITPQQLAVLNADANNYITMVTYVYRSVNDPKQNDTMYYVSTLANPNEDRSFIFLTITINKNTLMAKYGYSVINLDEIGGDYISITANNGVTSGNITQSQLELLQKSVNNTIFLNEEKYYLMDKETTENYLVYGCVVKDNTNTTWVKTITISKTNLGWSLTTLSLIGKTDFDNALLKTKQATKTSEMTNEIGVDSNGKLWTSGGNVDPIVLSNGSVEEPFALTADEVAKLKNNTTAPISCFSILFYPIQDVESSLYVTMQIVEGMHLFAGLSIDFDTNTAVLTLFMLNPVAKTSDMTVPVGIDGEGKLWTKEGGISVLDMTGLAFTLSTDTTGIVEEKIYQATITAEQKTQIDNAVIMSIKIKNQVWNVYKISDSTFGFAITVAMDLSMLVSIENLTITAMLKDRIGNIPVGFQEDN